MCDTEKSVEDEYYKKVSGKPVAYCKPCSNRQRSAFRVKAREANPSTPRSGFRALPMTTQRTVVGMNASNRSVKSMAEEAGIPPSRIYYYKTKGYLG